MSGELAGAMAERIAIERRTATRDALGGASGGWTQLASLWAAIIPDGQAPFAGGKAAEALPRWTVTIRAGFTPAIGDRVLWQGKRLRVRGVTADPRTPDRIEIRAEEER